MRIIVGFKSFFTGDKMAVRQLSIEDVSRIHSTGGPVLRTSRDPMDKAKEKFAVLLGALRPLNVRYLITI